ncbi:hypothetical protein [Methanosarcina mazei]|jgi:hypothetical protein|uniref:Uncharacterized protein n=6 Tax=Methanosarcina mazei TaxID=2209 RepID=A0A0F8T564_METMZ|nr:hypothetical protein [Methanosarcina mazei]AAM32742.1 conserved protein [Methanosarcina mazei Go1]AKB40574.1 hypothetical protein MSMAW_1583 [Methanosarcina mazei WWM610]AKB61555.1 hypothetical protein MSMAP_1570 [Methanosarcina mazei SarPi]AKB64839.1 hypothetical protein MSMAS_1643 [Methanosarcina mazei S-6]AKB72884.1 hypothetical protein MSMAC_2994 [Methanosarcina mazei C16]
MQDAKLIKVIAEYLAKCAEIHARGEPIPPESLEGFTIDIVSCLDVVDIGDIGKELVPLKRARTIIKLARREFEWQLDNMEHPEDWETCLRNAASGNV